MAIKIPDLDIRTFEEITLALEREIPKFTPDWDDFNYSDPGITILEMLVWVGETLAYRANRIPEQTYASFLALLGGASYDEVAKILAELGPLDPDYQEYLEYLQLLQKNTTTPPSVGDMREAAVRFFQAPYLAVTREDFQLLAMQTNRMIPDDQWTVGKAIVTHIQETVVVLITPNYKRWVRIADHYFRVTAPKDLGNGLPLSAKGSGTRLQFHRQVVAETFHESTESGMNVLLDSVRAYLKPRTLLGTVVRVVGVEFNRVEFNIHLYLGPGSNLRLRAAEIELKILQWLDPINGGPHGRGWPYNRLPLPAELVSLLLEMPDVKRVIDVQIKPELQIKGLDPNIALPHMDQAFTGYPLPTLNLTLNKLTSRRRRR